MKRFLSTKHIFFLILISILLPISAHAFPGKVVGITDGDTVKILRTDNHIQVKIRLAGIDTPEKKQAYGQKAKKFTASLIANSDGIEIFEVVGKKWSPLRQTVI